MYYLIDTKIGIASIVFFGLMIILPCFLFLVGSIALGILFFAIWGFVFFDTLFRCVAQKIVINSEGVKYVTPTKTINMEWKQIAEIGVKKFHFLTPSRQLWIYFSIKPLENRYLYGKPNKNLIFMHYRDTALQEIQKHCDRDIKRI